jgi:hypothetical protein
MSEAILTPFIGLVSDLDAAIARAIASLTSVTDVPEIAEAERLSVLNRDNAAAAASLRRHCEEVLSEGVPSKRFAADWYENTDALATNLLAIEQAREKALIRAPDLTRLLLSDLDANIKESRALLDLLNEALAAARAPLPEGLWQRAADAKGPFESAESIAARLRAGGEF